VERGSKWRWKEEEEEVEGGIKSEGGGSDMIPMPTTLWL
jgi:hypothetical protein